MHSYKKLFLATGTLLLATTMILSASQESKEKEKTDKAVASLSEAGNKDNVESGISANALIKKAYATIGALEKYSFEARIVNEDDLGSDMMIYLKHDYKVSVSRPDKIRMDVRGDVENKNTYFNGGAVSIIDSDNQNYGEVKVSADIDNALDDLIDKYGIPIPLTQLLYSDMAEDINASDKGYYLGTVLVDETPCYYVAFPGKEWDVQAWIEKGDKPLIRKVAFVDKMKKGQPRSMITIKWNLDPTFDEKIFNFKAPKGAKKAKVLTLEEIEKINVETKTNIDTKDEK
ncbi:hypothetical protein MNB_SV-5-975 [hydrothermal vent metagenome]|uniref:DUF2092 domain-containing protein n=1 Tax=hydrothermal vent metagenome TaxID=652676 RepID=A0A1W1EGD8_9ZZZZ